MPDNKTIIIVFCVLLSFWRPVSGGEFWDNGFTVISASLVSDPGTIVLTDSADPRNRIELSADEYPRSPEAVFLQSAMDSREDIERFGRLYRLRVDLLKVTIRAPDGAVLSSAALLGRLRDFAYANHANYVRDVTVLCDRKNPDSCLSVSGICGFGATEQIFNVWSVAVAKEELLNCAFMEKYRLLSAGYDYAHLSDETYRNFVNEYEALKQEFKEAYADFREIEQRFMRSIARCGIKNTRTLEETMYIDLPGTIIGQEAGSTVRARP